jgi:peroxiredoxin Q/BCP
MLKIGDKMPEFTLQNQAGETVSSQELLGKKTVIYFYPKDNTSGCTAEACNLRDNYHTFLAKGYNVVGVSKDSVASHKKFADKHELPFTLLSDPTTQMQQDFGVWGEKKMCGRAYFGTTRTTFVFDENGILEKVIEKVNTKDHTSQIL